MSAKPTGLVDFIQKGGAPATPQETPGNKAARPRAQGDTVALTLRVSKPEWLRLRQLADAEGMSLTALLKAGLSEELGKRGLPGLKE